MVTCIAWAKVKPVSHDRSNLALEGALLWSNKVEAEYFLTSVNQ